MLVIERKKSGQCEWGNAELESIQFKAILKFEFQIILNSKFEAF